MPESPCSSLSFLSIRSAVYVFFGTLRKPKPILFVFIYITSKQDIQFPDLAKKKVFSDSIKLLYIISLLGAIYTQRNMYKSAPQQTASIDIIPVLKWDIKFIDAVHICTTKDISCGLSICYPLHPVHTGSHGIYFQNRECSYINLPQVFIVKSDSPYIAFLYTYMAQSINIHFCAIHNEVPIPKKQ